MDTIRIKRVHNNSNRGDIFLEKPQNTRSFTAKIKVQHVLEKVSNYKNKWIQNIRRMHTAILRQAVMRQQNTNEQEK